MLDQSYTRVEQKSRALQTACETLLDDQTNLADVSAQLLHKLSYFNQLEPVTRLLSSPGEALPLDPAFTGVIFPINIQTCSKNWISVWLSSFSIHTIKTQNSILCGSYGWVLIPLQIQAMHGQGSGFDQNLLYRTGIPCLFLISDAINHGRVQGKATRQGKTNFNPFTALAWNPRCQSLLHSILL